MMFTKELVVNLFMLVIYIIILYIFNKAKNRYSGGMIEKVINLIIFSVFLMLCADYVPLLASVIPADFVYIIKVIFRMAALAVLAFGGLRLLAT